MQTLTSELENAEKFIHKNIKQAKEREKFTEKLILSKDANIKEVNQTHQAQVNMYKKVILDLQEAYEYQKSMTDQLGIIDESKKIDLAGLKLPTDDVTHVSTQTEPECEVETKSE